MRVRHTFKQMEVSEPVQFHAEERVKKLQRHLTKQDRAHVVYTKTRLHEYKVDIIISGHHKVFQSTSKSSEDFYAAIDVCVSKLVRQLAKKKDRLQRRRGPKGRTRPHREGEHGNYQSNDYQNYREYKDVA